VRRPSSVELFEKSQSVRQIRKLIHEVDLREESMPHVFKLRILLQPRGELFAPSCGDFVDDAFGAALRGSEARFQKFLLLQPFQGRINLAEFRGPEMSDAVVENGFQVESAGGFAEQTQQNVFEAHAGHYITCYINCNCFLRERGFQLDVCAGRSGDRMLILRLGNSPVSRVIITHRDRLIDLGRKAA
jgi:hypothetical protein